MSVCLQNGVDAMPVRVKGEPHDSNAPLPPPQPPPPPPPPTHSTNGASAAHAATPPATTSPPRNGVPPGASRTPSTSHPTSNHVGSSGATQGTNGVGVEKEKASVPAPEDAIDHKSVQGMFGWATVDDVNVPYIIRKERNFVAVRIVEKKMLSRYPNSFPDELGKKEPLVSYFVTEAEAKLLNEINTIHCSFEYGHQPFTTKDLIVDLVEFEDFYKLVKKTFPEDVLATISAEEDVPSTDDKTVVLSKMCGWMQINNTVTPYIVRSSGKFVPLSVIQYAAQLLTKDHVEGYSPTLEECDLLNATCRAAGFDFSFGRNTRLIHIAEVVRRCQVRIFELPFENPLQHAQYIDSLQQVEMFGGQPPTAPVPGGIAGSMSLPYQSKPILSEGPPNFNPFTPYNPFMSMMNMMSPAPPSAAICNQAPSSASMSNHSLVKTTQSTIAMPPGPQLSLVRTQQAPIFFPPAPPTSMPRVSQVNNNSLVSVPSGMVQGLPNAMVMPPRAAGVSPGSRPASPHGPIGSPANQAPGFSPHFVRGGGAPGAHGPGQFPRAPSPQGVPRLPPGYLPPHAHLMQRPGQPPMPSHPALHGASFMPPPHHMAGQRNGMMLPGMGPVPRGAVPMVGFPSPSGVMPGALPPQMGLLHHLQNQPHLQNQHHHLQHKSHAQNQPQVQSQLQMQSHIQSQPQVQTQPQMPLMAPTLYAPNKTSPSYVGVAPLAQPASSNPPVFPVQLSPAGQHRGSPAKLPGVESVPNPEVPAHSKVPVRPEPDQHLKLVADIKPVMVHGKSISCMRRDSPERTGSFCLVEAVAKLYFPKCSLAEFVNALHNVLQINLPVCSEQEAKAFIHFYNLPVTSLNDNHMIDLNDLNNYFPQISYMFRHASSDAAVIPSAKQQVITRRSSGSEGVTKLASPSTPITVVLNNNDSSEVISIDSGPPTPIDGSLQATAERGGGGCRVNKKRAGEEVPGAGSDSKVPCLLEQTPLGRRQTHDEVDGGLAVVKQQTGRAQQISAFCGPDMTSAVHWALTASYLSIYLLLPLKCSLDPLCRTISLSLLVFVSLCLKLLYFVLCNWFKAKLHINC